MKVVLFCGGLGTRLRDYSEKVPKPLVPLGYRPILWHVMKYYAHFGHTDFILCLGYKGDAIKEYFLNYDECLSNDFVLSHGARQVDLLRRDIEDWRITFVDTGISANIGERLKAVEPFLAKDEVFLANYSDGLTDFPLPTLIENFKRRGSIGTFLAVRPHYSFHFVSRAPDGTVLGVDNVISANAWINGGYFVFRREIFDYIRPGEELVEQPFQRLIEERQLHAHDYDGFWRCVDTFKDLQALENLYAQGKAPWELWHTEPRAVAAAPKAMTLQSPQRRRRMRRALAAADLQQA
ncbi:MAG: glucose-1-phosphate cytidylyltransferase [Alphaproteobacteria bacterium]|nr:glucose-1-phosphate cytidylyltransferase [Alphaproteobacteria bacterium]